MLGCAETLNAARDGVGLAVVLARQLHGGPDDVWLEKSRTAMKSLANAGLASWRDGSGVLVGGPHPGHCQQGSVVGRAAPNGPSGPRKLSFPASHTVFARPDSRHPGPAPSRCCLTVIGAFLQLDTLAGSPCRRSDPATRWPHLQARKPRNSHGASYGVVIANTEARLERQSNNRNLGGTDIIYLGPSARLCHQVWGFLETRVFLVRNWQLLVNW
jgi:hypothetical protein